MSAHELFLYCPATLPFVPVVRGAVHALIAEECDTAALYQLELAVSEVLTNVIKHAYKERNDGMMEIRVVRDATQVTFESRDTGGAFEERAPSLPASDALQEGGYGLFLATQAVDTLSYRRDLSGRNYWTITKRLTAS